MKAEEAATKARSRMIFIQLILSCSFTSCILDLAAFDGGFEETGCDIEFGDIAFGGLKAGGCLKTGGVLPVCRTGEPFFPSWAFPDGLGGLDGRAGLG